MFVPCVFHQIAQSDENCGVHGEFNISITMPHVRPTHSDQSLCAIMPITLFTNETLYITKIDAVLPPNIHHIVLAGCSELSRGRLQETRVWECLGPPETPNQVDFFDSCHKYGNPFNVLTAGSVRLENPLQLTTFSFPEGKIFLFAK